MTVAAAMPWLSKSSASSKSTDATVVGLEEEPVVLTGQSEPEGGLDMSYSQD